MVLTAICKDLPQDLPTALRQCAIHVWVIVQGSHHSFYSFIQEPLERLDPVLNGHICSTALINVKKKS